jgi:hypothetical protein
MNKSVVLFSNIHAALMVIFSQRRDQGFETQPTRKAISIWSNLENPAPLYFVDKAWSRQKKGIDKKSETPNQADRSAGN